MEEWKEYKLGEVCTELSDGLHKAPKFKFGGDYIFVNAKNIVNGFIVDNDPTKKSTYEEFLKYASPLDDTSILYSIDGTIGNVALYRGEKCILGKGACYMNPNPNILDRMFLYYELQSPRFKGYIDRMSTGSTIKHISLKTMRNYSFTFPSIVNQRQISSILKSLDDKIDVNRQINDNLEKQAQALFKSWFVDFEPFRYQSFEESELGRIPEGWRVGILDDIIKENVKSKIQVKEARGVMGEYPFFTSGSTILKYKVPLVTGRNLYLNTGGVAGVKYYIGNAAYSTDTWCICGIDNYSDYLYLYLKSIEDILNSQYFEGSALKHLKKKSLKDRILVIPPSITISEFNNIVVPMFDKINSLYHQNLRLATIRDTLLPRLMSGELKINDIEKAYE